MANDPRKFVILVPPMITTSIREFIQFRRIFFISIFLMAFFQMPLMAQQKPAVDEEHPRKIASAKDRIVFDLNYDAWTKTPDSIHQEFRSPGFNAYLMWDYPFGYGPFSIAFGAGLSTHAVQHNGDFSYSADGSYTSIVPRTMGYKVNKLVCDYVEVPVELRIRTRSEHSFKLAVGGKIGYAYSIHTKVDDAYGKRKIYRIKNVDPLRYGVTFRIGYNKFDLQAFYSLSELFKKGHGESGMVAYSVGLGILLF